MSFDAWIVGFGLSRVLIVLQLLASPAAYGAWLSLAIFDLYLLYLFSGDAKAPCSPFNRQRKPAAERRWFTWVIIRFFSN